MNHHPSKKTTPIDQTTPPLFQHTLQAESVFRPEDLVEAVKSNRRIQRVDLPEICVLEFDGDLTDKLQQRGKLQPCPAWPCFHTRMWRWEDIGIACGIIPRTIGGPYTVLVAEQLAACGVRAVIGLASAGRIAPKLPLPSVVLAEAAIRDEGTSYHYLPPAPLVNAAHSLLPPLMESLRQLEQPVHQGLVWTTDAPYRETKEQIQRHAQQGALAVEMQAASLFAFGERKPLPVALVAHVTNAADHDGEQFAKGSADFDIELLRAIVSGAINMVD